MVELVELVLELIVQHLQMVVLLIYGQHGNQ
jgi:hypothetical protein